MSLLEQPVISRIRRNHGLEHATIHILSKRKVGSSLVGHSDSGGFWLLGNVSTEEVADAATEALARLRKGESHLAIHPNCGTNFVTYGMAAGFASFLAMLGVGGRFRDKLERLPLMALFATIALIFAQPLGFKVQERVTTSGNPGEMEIVEVIRTKQRNMTAHRIVTKG